MICPDCGQPLVSHNPARDAIQTRLRAVGSPRFSKKKRLRKKFKKQWAVKNRSTALLAFILPLSGPGGFRCTACDRVFGFYQIMGRALLNIQPLPVGAIIDYGERS